MITALKAYTTVAAIAKKLKVTPGRVHQLLKKHRIPKEMLPTGAVMILKSDVAKIPIKRPSGRPTARK